MLTLSPLLARLDERRRALGMSLAALAKRSGVSYPTVFRLLSGNDPRVRLANVLAIAKAMGMDLQIGAESNADEFRERQAREKAKRLVGMVQSTSGLEGQAVDEPTAQHLTNCTTYGLLAGSGQKLWSE